MPSARGVRGYMERRCFPERRGVKLEVVFKELEIIEKPKTMRKGRENMVHFKDNEGGKRYYCFQFSAVPHRERMVLTPPHDISPGHIRFVLTNEVGVIYSTSKQKLSKLWLGDVPSPPARATRAACFHRGCSSSSFLE